MAKKAIQRFLRDDKGHTKVVLIDALTLQPVLNPAEYEVINKTELPYWEPVQDVSTPDVPSKVQPPAQTLNQYIQKAGGDPTAPSVKAAVQTHAATTPTATASQPTSPSRTREVQPASPTKSAEITSADVQKAEAASGAPSAPTVGGEVPAGIATPTRSRSPNPNTSAPDPAAPAPSGKIDVNGEVNPLGVGSAPKATFYHPEQEQGLSSRMRTALDKTVEQQGPLGITSGYRSPEHNKAVGGVKGSYHMKGDAVDIDLSGKSDEERRDIVRSLEDQNVGGLITYDASPDMLHVDMRPRDPAQAPHFMHNKTAAQMAKAPGWFQQEKAGAATRAYLGASPDELSNPGIPQARPDQPNQTVAGGIINQAKDVSKTGIQGDPSKVSAAQMAGLGLMTNPRTPDQISRMAAAFAGELSPSQLDALAAGDETARKELAGMITTAENRAAKAKSFDSVFDPSQYNSMLDSKQSVTKGNYAKYGTTLRDAIGSYYTGDLKPESYDDTGYYNPDISDPAWGTRNKGAYGLMDAKQVGDHTFGFTKDRMGRTTDLSGQGNRPSEGSRFGLGGLGRGLDSPSEGGARFGGQGLGQSSYSGKGGENSPSEGAGHFGGGGLGTSNKSSGSDKDKDRSADGRSVGPSGGGKAWGGPH